MALHTYQSSDPEVTDHASVAFPPSAALSETEVRLKFINDLTVGECLQLNCLQYTSSGYVLIKDQSLLQRRLHDTHASAANHNMKLNLSTCKSMVFNFSKNFQFLPDLYLEGTNLSLAQETKLLGVTITNDCK